MNMTDDTYEYLKRETQRIAKILTGDVERMQRMLARGTHYVWLKPSPDVIKLVGGMRYELVEAATYPHEAPRGCTISIDGLMEVAQALGSQYTH